ncbi:MAG: GDP-mannose 4,6-dehydratase [Planctomycetes bacterium]|nr:GDP-mannose 4,6-dehydratase [Planctomycetota bacterium]
MKRHYLVTGGAGFIGSHVASRLLRAGHRVTVLDNFSTGSRANLDAVRTEVGRRASELKVVEGSVTDARAVATAFDGIAGVVHLAALPSVVRSVEAPLESHDHNVTGTVQVLDAARRCGVRVVYAGSSSAYGEQDAQLKHEELRESPLSPYAASKLAGELYARAFGRVYDASVVVTRFFNVYGPRQVPDSPYSGVVAAFCFALLRGAQPRIDGDGSQTRDFTYVGDVAEGVARALEADLAPGCHTVNLAGGGNYSIRELLATLTRHAGADVEPVFGPARAGDVKHSQADVSRLRALLGYVPSTSFDAGLRATFDWYRQTYGETAATERGAGDRQN